MNRQSTAREALVAELIGDAALLLDRVESVTPAVASARQALDDANARLVTQLDAFERRITAISAVAATRAVEHIARQTDAVGRQSLDANTRAMTDAARTLFHGEVGPMLQRLVASLQQAVDQATRPWDLWLTHAATAAVSAGLASGLTWWLLRG